MTFRWGIAGTGRIASDFVRDFAAIEDGRVSAVGSRTTAGAEKFASSRNIARVHGSIADLAADPDIDIVYVAGIHPVHREHAVMMLEAGKHVLVEKPLAMSPSEVESIIEASRSSGRFMMEAMWMRFNPLHVELKSRIDTGEFGPVEFIESDFTFEVPRDPSHRLFDPAKGGGALLDVGIYPLNLAWWWLGEPDAWSADGTLGPTGVDESVRMELEWRDGAKALLTCGSTAPGPRTSTITCRSAVIRIDAPSHASPTATIESNGTTERVEASAPGLHHQAREVQRCVAAGDTQSPRMPHAESLAISRFMDDVLASINGD